MAAPFTQSNASSSSHGKRRHIPGPVGQYLLCRNSKSSSFKKSKHASEQAQNNTHRVNNQQNVNDHNPYAGNGTNNNKIVLNDPALWNGAWLKGCVDNGVAIEGERDKLYMLKNDSFMFESHCGAIKQRVGDTVFRAPKLMVLVKTLTVAEDGLSVVLDPFGSVFATFTNRVLSQHPAIGVGCVLVLSNVVVYQAEAHQFFLAVAMDAIHRIYAADTGVPYELKETLRQFRKKIAPKHHPTTRNPKSLQTREKKMQIDPGDETRSSPSRNDCNDYYDKGINFADTNHLGKREKTEDEDDDIIPELDMYKETPRGKVKAVCHEEKNKDDEDVSSVLAQVAQPEKSKLKATDKSASPGPMNLFNDLSQASKNEQIPKDLNLVEQLFSQLDRGQYFFDDER